MDVFPGIIVVSSSNTKPKSIIKLITKAKEINVDSENSVMIKQPWLIDTKYYTAEVNFFGLETEFERNQEFNNKVEALIVHMDSNKSSGLEDLSKWDSFDKDCSLEVKLLVSNYCTDETKITKNTALEWCLKRGFEFIELYPSLNNEDEDSEIREKFGVERIVEALHSHTWPNLKMKNKSKNSKSSQQGNNEIELRHIQEPYPHDIADDFTELFSQLHMMKDSLQSMPMSQRKQCAEQMVTAFWKAIGGEEEEIDL